ncbi:MAG: DUF962 domain-containing protein [Candidatus Obscuribacterales bacterium]|nr:DUF962 domain-containing protein [Candidatus Obscuribacterales bacterium]
MAVDLNVDSWKKDWADSFQSERAKYESNHRTPGCRVTHMFGVPMIILSLPVFFFNRKGGLTLFAVGWILQFYGHLVFEKNSPVFLENPWNPNTYVSALSLVGNEWMSFFKGFHESLMSHKSVANVEAEQVTEL